MTGRVPTGPVRCDCRGECATRSTRRVCADPDLEGRCRAVNGQPHPRALVTVTVRAVRNGGRYCAACAARVTRALARGDGYLQPSLPLEETAG